MDKGLKIGTVAGACLYCGERPPGPGGI